MSNIELQHDDDIVAVEELLDITFGTDRFEKAAYALRRNVDAIPLLSFVIREGDHLIATLRFWPVKVGGVDALLLGPIAVMPDLQGKGFGIRLMEYGLSQAKAQGHSRVILVGDENYYSRIGFSRATAQGLTMPGQADVSRLLAVALKPDAFKDISGLISKG